jgi:HAE1 family hydrophobic/amphiphilic exporter-1
MESQITRPIESAMTGITGVDQIRSVVTQGVSTTFLQFQMGSDMQKATDDVRAAVDRTRPSLPRDIEAPQVTRVSFEDQPLITYAVSAPDMSVTDLSWFIDDTVNRRLTAQPGIARIDRVGGVNREINVLLDPVRMEAQGLTANQVNDALNVYNLDVPGGRVTVGGQEQTLRILGAAVNADQVRNLTIAAAGGRFVRIGDVADVGDGSAEPRALALLNGRPVVGFQVVKTRDGSDVAVEDAAERTLAQIRRQHPNVTFERIVSGADQTRAGFAATLHTLLEGMALAALVVFIFLRDWRATVITAVAMPVSLIPTFAFMHVSGFSLNMVTLLGLTLVIGILVDDAIVEIENIEKRVHRGQRPYQAAMEGADQIGLAVVATTGAIAVVFAPVGFMPGIPGQFFREFGLTVSVSVLFSLVVARLLTPLLAAYFLTPKEAKPRKPLPRFYLSSLNWALDHRILSAIIGGVTFIASVGLVAIIPKGIQPEGNPNYFQIDVQGPPGSTLDDMRRAVAQVEALARRQPETTSTFTVIGGGGGGGGFGPGGGGGGSGVTSANVIVVLRHPPRDRVGVIRDRLRPHLREISDARATFNNAGFGAAGVSLTLTSETGEGLDQAAMALLSQLRTLPGVADPRTSTPPPGPEVVVRPRPAEAARLGVSPVAIASAARIATVGDSDANVPKLNEGERRIPVRVRLPQSAQNDLAAIRAMRLPTASGGFTTLDSVADVYFQAGPGQIDRINRQRQLTVVADLAGGAQLGDILQQVSRLPIMRNLPPGVGRATQGQEQAIGQLFGGFVIALFTGVGLVFGVMVLLFRSFFKPLVILSALPTAVGGAFLALLLWRSALMIPSLIGFFMLMGLAAKNSILLVEYAIERERAGAGQRQALIEACTERARPIVMTTFAMAAGMLPTALTLGEGSEFRQPMAVAVIGGLMTSTVLSLILVPVVYEFVDDFERWLSPIAGRLATPRDAMPEPVPEDRL